MRTTWLGTIVVAAVGVAALFASVVAPAPVAQADPFVAPPGWEAFQEKLAESNTALFLLSSPQLGVHGSSLPLFLAADRNANRVMFYPSNLGDNAEKLFLLSNTSLWRIPPAFSETPYPLPRGQASQAIALELMSGLATSQLSNEQGGVVVRFPFPWAGDMAVLVDMARVSVPQDVAAPGALFFKGWGMGATLYIHDVAWNIVLPPSFYAEPSGPMASTLLRDLHNLAVSLPMKFEPGGHY